MRPVTIAPALPPLPARPAGTGGGSHVDAVTPLWRMGVDGSDWDVALIERTDLVCLAATRPVTFVPNGTAGERGELWIRSRRGRSLIWSWRKGSLRTYLVFPSEPGRKRSFRDVSPQPGTVDSVVQSMLGTPDPTTAAIIGLDSVVARLEARLPIDIARPEAAASPALWLAAACYPALVPAVERGLVPVGLRNLPTCMTPALRERTARGVAQRLFGPSATRRIVRAIGRLLAGVPGTNELRLMPVVAAQIGRGVLEPDHLVQLLELAGPTHTWLDPFSPSLVAGARRLLRPLTVARQRRLLAQAIDHELGPLELADAVRMATRMPSLDATLLPRDLHELHDELAARSHELEARSRRIDAPSWLDGLHDTPAGEHLRFVVPTATDQLRSWGRQMHNCIGSYGPAAAAGEAFLLGVERDGDLAYNIELDRSGRIVQLLGPANTQPRPDEAAQIVAALASRGLAMASASW